MKPLRNLRFALGFVLWGQLVLLAPVMQAQEEDGDVLEATIASQLREALSLDPTTLAALDVKAVDVYDLAFDAISDAADRKELLRPFMEWSQYTHRACADAWTKKDFDAVLADQVEAIDAFLQNGGDWSEGYRELFDEDGLAALRNAAANAVLESPLRLLELSEEQRAILWSAQALRDRALLNPYISHRASWVAIAWEEYWKTVEETLTREQYDGLSYYYERLEANLPGVLEVESQVFEDSKQAAASRWFPILAELRPHARELMPQAVAWARGTLSLTRGWWRSALAILAEARPAAKPTMTLGMAGPPPKSD